MIANAVKDFELEYPGTAALGVEITRPNAPRRCFTCELGDHSGISAGVSAFMSCRRFQSVPRRESQEVANRICGRLRILLV